MSEKYIGNKRLIINIHSFLLRKSDYLKMNEPDTYEKMLDKYGIISGSITNRDESKDIDIKTKEKRFNKWLGKKKFNVKYFELLFDPETLDADINDIFGEEPIASFDNRQHNYYQMLSIDSISQIRDYIIKKCDKDEKFSMSLFSSQGITLPVLYHLTTQSFLLVRFRKEKRLKNSLTSEYIYFSVSDLKTDYMKNYDDNDFYICLMTKKFHCFSKHPEDIIGAFKIYAADKIKRSPMSTLAMSIASETDIASEEEQKKYINILKQPLFKLYRNVDMFIKEQENKKYHYVNLDENISIASNVSRSRNNK